MDLFAPSNLPGVGMGDLRAVVAILGAVGIAVTSGALLAEGAIGTIVFVVGALAVLQEKPDFGGSVPGAVVILAALLLLAAARLLLEQRARREDVALAGAAKDAPETKAAQGQIERRRRFARGLTLVAVALGSGVVGFAWAEWNEVPFTLQDGEAWSGLVLGVVAGAIGGDAIWRFMSGAVRAGGSAPVMGAIVAAVVLALNTASVYVPFAGGVVLLLFAVLAIRLRRRSSQKYAGLRILG